MDNDLIKLATSLGECLQKKSAMLVVAESCTGGGFCQLVTEIAGSSHWFERGFVSYSNNSKIQMLDVKEQTLILYGAVSKQTALEMAYGALQHSDADYAVSITGIAGPDGGSISKPVGTVFIALQNVGQSICYEKHFIGTRHEIRHQTIKFALDSLLSYISN